MAWLWLSGAIITELIATLCLRQAATAPAWWLFTVVALGYALSFAQMTISLRVLNVGVVYAVWSALGTATVAIAGTVLFDERLNWRAILGLVVLLAGVVVLVTSGSVRHD